MSKEGRVRGGRGSNGKSSSVPYATITRRERSRKLAQKRRDIYKQIMEDMIDVMPFPKDVVSQLDYNSRLRLTICFFRMKSMLKGEDEEEPLAINGGRDGEVCRFEDGESDERLAVCEVKPKPSLFPRGMMQELMCESLDGFLMVIQLDGNIIFLSESIHKHLGLFQSEHIGINMYELILEEDHAAVKERLAEADDRSVKRRTKHGTTEVSFFCRMKCSRFKMANGGTKSPGYKLVYVSGTLKVAESEPFIACVVRPVSSPSVLELRTEGNMFVAHYSMEFSCIYFDGRLRHLLGYTREDFLGKTPFSFQHHDDIESTMQCSRQVQSKGVGVSGYYRFLNRFGEYIWIQSRAVISYDSRTGNPSHIVCTSYVISKEDGNKDLLLRQAVASGQSEFIEKNLTPESSFATKKLTDGRNLTNQHIHKDANETTKVGGATYVAKIKHKEPAGTGVTNGNRRAANEIEENGDPSYSTPHTSKKPTSVLYSMLAGSTVSSAQTSNSRQKKAPVNSVRASKEALKEKELSLSASSSPSSQLHDYPRSQSDEFIEESPVPDSTSYSNASSPYGPPSIHQGERRSRSVNGDRKMSFNERTLSGSDLGYHSESASSLRDRLTSNFTGYESESSVCMYESGPETSPPNVYSPDYPLSVLSSDGSVGSGLSFMMGSPSDSHSPFQNPSSIHSQMDEAAGSPTYLLPLDESEFVGGGSYHQLSPGGGGSVVNGESELMSRSKVMPWRATTVSLSSPSQYSSMTSLGGRDAPGNYNQRGVAFAKMPSPLSGFARSSGGVASGHMILPGDMGSPQYSSGSPSPQTAASLSPEQGATQTSSSGSVLLSDVIVSSVTNGTSHTLSTLQATASSAATEKGGVSCLPQLTAEDLNILDSFDGEREDDQFRQLLYHQTSISCRGTMMM